MMRENLDMAYYKSVNRISIGTICQDLILYLVMLVIIS